jgi:hypothetical protein
VTVSWGVRRIGELGEADLDPHLLMWDIQRHIPIERWPRARTTVAFHLAGVAPKASRWWLVVAEGRADVCDFDPGYDVTATVAATLRCLVEIWRGDLSWSRALLDGSVATSGAADARRSVPTWLGQSKLAAVPRPA